jgi:ribosomal protein S18 acetylase RimI-like enzyme
MMNDIQIRPALSSDQTFLEDMLYQSLYVPEGHEPFPKDIIHRPELAKYVEQWGKTGDIAFIAVDSKKDSLIGAIWLRLLEGSQKGYGYVNDETPEVGVAVLPEYRGQGIGTQLFEGLFEAASVLYNAISLSVSKGNPAQKLYESLGFEVFAEDETAITMLKFIP